MAVFKKILAVFLSVIILSMSFAGSIFVPYSMSRVYATEIGIAVAGESAWELIVAFLAGFGVAGAAVSNKEAVKEKVMEVWDSKFERDEALVDQMAGVVMNIYDSASGAVRSVPWDEYVEALKGYHDSAVDSLTGIYVQYCPQLIGMAKDFAYGIATGAIAVEGLNNNVYLNEEVINKQWSGDPFVYSSTFSAISVGTRKEYTLSKSYNIPVAGYLNIEYASRNEYSLHFFTRKNLFSVTTINLKGTMALISDKTFVYDEDTTYVSSSGYGSFSYTANFPVFVSQSDMENYLLGRGDVTGAINWDGVIDNDDLPLWGLAKALADMVAMTPDIGIGSLGSGASVNDWADDIPFVGLGDLQDYIDKVEDVIDKVRDGLLDGTYDLPADIPDVTDPYTDAWDDVVDGSIPADDPIVKNPVKPVPGEGDITGDDVIEVPDEIINPGTIVPDLSGGFSDIADILKHKFPFSIPWDIYHLLSKLAATRKTPVYKLPLVIERWGVNEIIVVDMSGFEDISRLSRAFLSFIWIMLLMRLTFSIVSIIQGD